MEIETPAAAAAALAGDELRRLLAATLSPDKASVDAAAAGLDRAAADPRFPLAILAVAAGIRIPFLPSGHRLAISALRPCQLQFPCGFRESSRAFYCAATEFNFGGDARGICAARGLAAANGCCLVSLTVVPWKDYLFPLWGMGNWGSIHTTIPVRGSGVATGSSDCECLMHSCLNWYTQSA
jgi:hypothetical protein